MADFKPMNGSNNQTEENVFTCTFPACMLCLKGLPICLTSNYTTWKDIAKVLLYSMQTNNPTQEYFHLKYDIYPFIMSHKSLMAIIQPKISSGTSWHKQLQDALSHDKRLFQSGIAMYGKNGFWRLNECDDPWTLTDLQFKHFSMESPPSSPSPLSSPGYMSSSDYMENSPEKEAQKIREEFRKLRQRAANLDQSVSRLVAEHNCSVECCMFDDVINNIDAMAADVNNRAASLLNINSGHSSRLLFWGP